MKKSKRQDIDKLKMAIREVGLRATPARVATLSLLHESSSPLTHAEVARHLDEAGVDKATAFRNLNDLAAAGILRRTELGDHVWRFEVIADKEHEAGSHPHFVCIDCGNVSCMDEVKLTASSVRHSQKFGEITEILLRGHCVDCS